MVPFMPRYILDLVGVQIKVQKVLIITQFIVLEIDHTTELYQQMINHTTRERFQMPHGASFPPCV